MSREDKIDGLIKEIEKELTDSDSFMVVFLDGITNEVSTGLLSRDPSILISSICEIFDLQQGDNNGMNYIDLFSSVIITYAKKHPKFATSFIKTFNKVMYGTDINIC